MRIRDLSFSVFSGNQKKIHNTICGTVKCDGFKKMCQMIVFLNEILQKVRSKFRMRDGKGTDDVHTADNQLCLRDGFDGYFMCSMVQK